MNFINIFNEFFIIDKKLNMLPIPCIIVENIILDRIGYEKGKRNEKLKEIQDSLSQYGLKTITHKHFIDFLRDYYPNVPHKILEPLENRCKYRITPILCYENVDMKEHSIDIIKSKLAISIEDLNKLLQSSKCLYEIYRIHRSIYEEHELFYNRRNLVINLEESIKQYTVDTKTGVVYEDKFVPVGSMNYQNLDLYIDTLFSDAKDIYVEYSKLEKKFPIFNIQGQIYSPIRLVCLDGIVDEYKNRKTKLLEELGMSAYFSVIIENRKNDYILVPNEIITFH